MTFPYNTSMRLFSGPLARRVLSTAAATVLLFSTAACGNNIPLNMEPEAELLSVIGTDTRHLTGQFAGAGSSAQKAAVEAWIAGYNTYQPDVDIAYDPSGSGAGVNSFLQGATLWAGSDKALTQDQKDLSREVCMDEEAIDLPVYISPLAVIYNLPGLNDEHLTMSADVIADIFDGTITTWNDERIADLNPALADRLPDTRITPVWRSDKSGTTNSFQQFLSQAAPENWKSAPQETWPNAIGQGAKGTSGVVTALSQAVGTIGYADAAQSSDLGTVAVAQLDDAGQSVGVAPDSGKAANLAAEAIQRLDEGEDMTLDIDYSTRDEQVYPIVQISYSIVCPSYSDDTENWFVGSWLTFQASKQGQQLAASTAGSAPLPSEVSEHITKIGSTMMGATS